MSLISIELARQHLRLDLDPGDDAESLTLPLYVAAAEDAALDYLNRAVYPDAPAMAAAIAAGTAGVAPMVAKPVILAAILLILGHLYANREDSVVGISVVELPNGARSLLFPHRVGLGV